MARIYTSRLLEEVGGSVTAEPAFYAPGEIDHDGLFTTRRFRMAQFVGRPRSEHAGVELFFTRHDPQTIRLGKTRAQLAPESYLVFNARETHGVERGHGTFSALVIPPHALATAAGELSWSADDIAFDHSVARPAPIMRRCLDDLLAARDVPFPDRLALDTALTQLVIQLLVSHRHDQWNRVRALRAAARLPSLVARAKAAIHERALEPGVGLTELARHSGCSPFHFIRAVKAATGATPIQLRNRIRIEAAKSALARSKAPISAIAYDVGFAELSTFNRAFVRLVGVAPHVYRKAINA